MISFADRSRQIPTRPTSTNDDQHVLADTSHASEYQSEYQYNTSDFDCHTPRTEDAKPSSSRDTDRNEAQRERRPKFWSRRLCGRQGRAGRAERVNDSETVLFGI